MRLAEDDRARVPFALLGVLLAVGSAAYVAVLADQPEPSGRPAETAALERADAVVDAAVQRGVARGARAAARDPVVEPAATPTGRVLNGTDTFRDYLRVRVYVAVREQLSRNRVAVGDVRAVPSLPATPDPDSLRAAKRSVHLDRVDGGLRVRIENVTVSLHRGGRVVERRDRTVVRTVATPVLAVHERVREYERRLDREPTAGPGLGRRLTARLYAVAWTRGYAQYSGAPIRNVVANRHVELMTNGALLETQRSVLGRSDPAGRRALGRATAAVATTDVLDPGEDAVDDWRERVLRQRPGVPADTAPLGVPSPRRPPTGPDETLTVDVGPAADRAFASFVGEADGPLDETIADVYGARVRLASRVERVAAEPKPAPSPPGDGWTLTDERVTEHVRVQPGDGPTPAANEEFHPLGTYTRRVVVRSEAVRTWVRGDDSSRTRQTTANWTEELAVGVAVVGRHAPTDLAPERGVDVVHERGGPLDGPNLRGVEATAVGRLVEGRGGPDVLARRATTGALDTSTVRVDGEQPSDLRAWLYPDLASLRDDVRNVTVTVRRGRLGTGETIPEARLAAALRERRARLVDAPGTYGSVADKARVAARAAYVDAVVARLEARAEEARRTRTEIDAALVDAGVAPDSLGAVLDVRDDVPQAPPRPVVEGRLVGRPTARVSGSPQYLTLAAVSHDRVPAVSGERYHPLVARNVNVFASPHADVADGVTAHLFTEEGRVNLRTAARALQSANRTLAAEFDPELRERRDALRREVADAMGRVRWRLQWTLTRVAGLPEPESEAAVREALAEWDTTAARALAVANGSVTPVLVDSAVRRLEPTPTDRERDWLALGLRVALVEVLSEPEARPPGRPVEQSATVTERVTGSIVGDAVEEGIGVGAEEAERRWGDRFVGVPSGLPLAPVPGNWYATTNVWHVGVRGEYARFAVTVPSMATAGPMTYERDGATVALDVDVDGVRERVGRASRVTFDVSTSVVVVVPPGNGGVGDVDGDADERSGGWPRPGNASAAAGE